MKNKLSIVALVVGLIALLAAFIGLNRHESAPVSNETKSTQGGGNVTGNIDTYTNGLTLGNETEFNRFALIGPGKNQGSFRNTTGRTLLIASANIGYLSGTASSSYLYYVATSTSATLSNDFARPTGAYLMIDGATSATSSQKILITATSTAAGAGSVLLQDGDYLNFQVQERYACKTVGICETSTSTNRGISNFYFRLKALYATQ